MSMSSTVRGLCRAGRLHDRRRRDLGCLLGAAACAACLPARAGARRVLRVLAWPGYAEPDLVRRFEQAQAATVELTVVDTDEALARHLQSASSGRAFDVVALNTAELQRHTQRGWMQPLQLERLPGRARQLARFQDLVGIPGLWHQGHAYGIPYAWSEMGLIYNPDRFERPPSSLAALWDPRLQGRVLAYDGGTHAFSLAALRQGLPSPFQIPPGQWPALARALVALRRNVSGFYTEPEESLDLWRRRGAWLMLANYGRQQVQLFQRAGLDVRYTLPQEGALAWLDCWAIPRQATEVALAHAWIDHLLSPEASVALRDHQGLGATTPDGETPAASGRLVWLQPVEDDERRNRLWRRIMAGDSPDRVLAP